MFTKVNDTVLGRLRNYMSSLFKPWLQYLFQAVGEMVDENGELEQDRMEGVDPKEWEE